MVTFKALESPSQTFGFEGSTYQAAGGFFSTADEKLIAFLSGNRGFAKVESESATPEPKKARAK